MGSDIDVEYLRGLWDAQGGKCALSGITMILPPTTLAWERRTGDPWKASLDRIDNARGYFRDNVRFVTVIANVARQNFSDADLVKFCTITAEFHRDSRRASMYPNPNPTTAPTMEATGSATIPTNAATERAAVTGVTGPEG